MPIDNIELYYEYLYPYQTITKWLTYGGQKPLSHRELSFEYDGGIVQRYVVFNTPEAMKQRMTSRGQNVPVKVDAGAIWTEIPKKDSPGRTQQRQLVFDFDMNDYDDVRNCCQGKTVCKKCWKLLVVAMEIIRTTLEEDFDLHKFMYVFSGGRGVHIWVCDERARKMKDSVRRSLVDYLELVTGNDKADSMLSQNVFRPIQRFILSKGHKVDFTDRKAIKAYYLDQNSPQIVQRSLQIIEKKDFLSIFKQQEALEREKGRAIVQKILKTRSQKLRNRVVERWSKCQNETLALYRIVQEEVQMYELGSIVNRQNLDYPMKQLPKFKEYKNLTFVEEEIMLTFLYPRMDYNVSTAQNHLLKLPFSIHPGSRKISVPMFPDSVEDFDPNNDKIKFSTLIKELEELGQKYKNQLTCQQALKESPIAHYVRAMDEFIDSMSKIDEE